MGLVRYGLHWNGPTDFICTEMADGHWTPWHIAEGYIATLEAQLAAAESTLAGQLATIEALTVGTDGSTPAIVQLARMEERLAAAEADAGRYQDVLQKIQSWCEAYPLDVFPEPDWSEVKDKLGAKLLSRVSASNMRHVVLGVKKLCDDAALQATAKEGE